MSGSLDLLPETCARCNGWPGDSRSGTGQLKGVAWSAPRGRLPQKGARVAQQAPARAGEDDRQEADEGKPLTVGVVAAPGVALHLAEEVAEELPDLLSERF